MRRAVLVALVALLALPATASAQRENRHSDSMSFVKNLPFDMPAKYGQDVPYGTDVEFGTVKGKRYAFAGSELNGLQIVDITNPGRARIVTAYDCAVSQGDPQVFKRGAGTYVAYANDYEANETTASSRCYREADRRFDAIDEEGNSRLGTMIIDVTNVKRPKVASFVSFPRGSHNTTVHPSGNYLYNSNSDLLAFEGGLPAIEVVDIRNFAKPEQTAVVDLTPLPGLGADSHDITFNDEGTRAYSAALSHGVILNTEDPAHPTIVSEFDDEAINVWHQADPVTIGGRDFLIVEDEVAGAAGPPVCPTGGVHVFDITEEQIPVRVGYWNIDDLDARSDYGPLDTCTAHVFDIHEDEQVMTIAYYMGGVRVVDLSGLADLPIGVGQGEQEIPGAMRQIGHYVFSDANAWSAKTPYIEPDGDFYLYADDINRGLDIFRFDASRAPSRSAGTFTTAAATQRTSLGLPDLTRRSARKQSGGFLCMLQRVNR